MPFEKTLTVIVRKPGKKLKKLYAVVKPHGFEWLGFYFDGKYLYTVGSSSEQKVSLPAEPGSHTFTVRNDDPLYAGEVEYIRIYAEYDGETRLIASRGYTELGPGETVDIPFYVPGEI